MKQYTPIYDLKQPPCEDINEALMELDSIIYTIENGEMTINERIIIENKCDAISKFIRNELCPLK